MAEVSLSRITKNFGAVEILKGIDLSVADGEFCVFVGPSGCGKSTLLRVIAGLEESTSGALTIGGKDMTRTPPANRGVAMVFQSYALYPHMTVAENISFGMRMAKSPKAEISRRLARASTMLQLEPYLDRKPSQLAGGQRQRVAIGRAVVREPDVFLFDEPLSNLDAALRVQTRIEIGKLHQDLRSTMIYVTHDQVEAMTMADKIVVLNAGRIEQVGSPLDLYHRPRNMFVAGFIGSPKMNFLKVPGRVEGDKLVLSVDPAMEPLAFSRPEGISGTGEFTLGIRPEHLVLMRHDDGGLPVNLRLAERLGSETMLYGALADGREINLRADGLSAARQGDLVKVQIPQAACHVFDEAGNTLINGDLLRMEA